MTLQKVLSKDLGTDWKDKFHTFNSKPFAAASIGQVHYATLHDGRQVAIKVQVVALCAVHMFLVFTVQINLVFIVLLFCLSFFEN